MPSSILNTDIMYPNLNGKTTEQQVFTIMNYLYMLKEQLTYSLSNLGIENINSASFDEMAGIITQPVFVQLNDQAGNLADLTITVGQVSSQLEDAEGNISTLQQTAENLSARLTDAEGNINSLFVTSESLSSTIEDVEGNVSTLFQTSDSLTSRISTAEGNISTLQQTATSLTSRVGTLEGDYTEIAQTVNGLTFSVNNGSSSSVLQLLSNGVQLTSATIRFTGMVTFSDLENEGNTTINGGNITTGVLRAIDIEGVNVYGSYISGSVFETLLETNGTIGGEIKMYYIQNTSDRYLAGGLRLDDEGGNDGGGDNAYRLFLYTNTVLGAAFALKLESAGSMSLESGENMYLSAPGEISIGGTGTTVNLIGTVRVNGNVIS